MLVAYALFSCNDEHRVMPGHLLLNLCLIVLIVSRHLQGVAVADLHMVCAVHR